MATATTKQPPKHVSAQDHSAGFSNRQRTIALIVVALAFIMDLLDGTIVNVAIPTIQANLGASYATIQWLIAGYTLSFALLLITGGRMGDVYGYKKIFIVGVTGFTVASLLSGVAVNAGMLIASRLLQGSMAALMVPQVISLMQVMYKPEERGAINGLFGGLAGVAASLGPIVGGLLIKANVAGLDWRPIFLINVPVGIFAVVAALKYLPNGKSSHPLKLDLIGTMIVVVAMSLLVYPLIQGREAGWPLWTYLMLLASIPVFLIFIRWILYKDKHDGSPLIVPSLFRKRSFNAGMLVNLLFDVALLSFFLTSGLVLQIGLGFSALHAAITNVPLAIGIGGAMGALGKVIPKLGRKAPMLGVVIVIFGLLATSVVFRRYGITTHSWQLIPSLLITGIGMAFVFASLFAIVLNDVDVKHAGAASGLMNAVQQVGGSIGVALIGVVFFGQISHGGVSHFQAQEPQLRQHLTALHVPAQAQQAIVSGSERCFKDRSTEKDSTVVPASCKQSTGDSDNKAIGEAISTAALKANADNFAKAFQLGVVFMSVVLAAIYLTCFMLPRFFRAEAYQEAV